MIDTPTRRRIRALAQLLLDHSAQRLPEREDKVIALVGAGASAPAGIPTGDRLKQELLRTAQELVHRDVLERELSERNTTLEEASLEELTQILCRYRKTQRRIIAKISELCLGSNGDESTALPSLLIYELLAHMVKHGFIDHVISMNFDELLDDALEAELESDSFLRVVSEKDTILEGELAPHIACLVKPHGTVSSPRSLRFTREDVKAFPEEIKEFIEEHLVPKSSNLPNAAKVTLLVFGFSMRDKVLEEIIRNCNISCVYRFDVQQPRRRAQAGATSPIAFREVDPQLSERLIVSPAGADAIEDLWTEIERLAQRSQTPLVAIARHQLVNMLFGRPRSGSRRGRTRAQFVDRDQRLRLELLLAAAKCKGKFTTYNLARSSRIERYLPSQHGSRNRVQLFREMVEGDGEWPPLFRNEYQRHKFRGENYYLHERDFGTAINHLEKLERSRHHRLRNADKRLLKELYTAVLQSDEVEVARAPDPRTSWQFVNPDPIHTTIELHQRTRETILDPRLERLFVIAETGAWLRHPWIHKLLMQRKPDIELITIRPEEFAPLAELALAGGQTGNTRGAVAPRESSFLAPSLPGRPNPLRIHWWEHNRHMTIGAKRRGDNEWEGLRGIYFRRRLNRPLIRPAYLEDAEDLETLMDIFRRHRRKYFRQRVDVSRLAAGAEQQIDRLLKEAYAEQGSRRPQEENLASIRSTIIRPSQHYAGAYYTDSDSGSILVGVVSFSRERDKVAFSVVGVLPDWQENGVGRILVEYLEETVRREGAKLIQLTTPRSGESVPFLVARGYEHDPDEAAADRRRTPMRKAL